MEDSANRENPEESSHKRPGGAHARNSVNSSVASFGAALKDSADALRSLYKNRSGAPAHAGAAGHYTARRYHVDFPNKTLVISLVAAVALVALIAVVALGISIANQPRAGEAPEGASTLVAPALLSGTQTVTTQLDASSTPIRSQWIAENLVTRDALLAVDATVETPSAFALSGADEPAITSENLASVAEATSAIEGAGDDVGCLILNLNTGQGIAYNLDESIFGASTFKGPFCAYVYERNDPELGGEGISSSTSSTVGSIIQSSDNRQYTSMRMSYNGQAFGDWLEECGASRSLMSDTSYPHYTARESSLLWLHTYRYLEKGTTAANELAGYFQNTNLSPIRAGITAIDSAAVVMNKAGWNAGGRWNSMSDAGIIQSSRGTFLISVMTNQPDSTAAEERTQAVATALFNACP